MKFPIEEGKIFILGQEISSGLKAQSDIFPSPPVNTQELDDSIEAYIAERDAAVAAQSAAAAAVTKKQAALQAMAEKIKHNIRYAEQTVDFDDDKLKTIGWGGRRKATPLAAPGRALDLASGEHGDGAIKLSWKKPIDGGKVFAYEIRYRDDDKISEGWKAVKTSMSTEIELTGQPRGMQLEYVVVSMNKAGEGPMSNSVMAVL